MIKIGLYNITITDNDKVKYIDSDLSDFMPWEMAYSLETMILTHSLNGIDVTSNEYQQGILDAVNSLKNNLK